MPGGASQGRDPSGQLQRCLQTHEPKHGKAQPCCRAGWSWEKPASGPAVPWVVVVTESLFLPSSLCLCWSVELRHHQPPEHSSWRVDDVSGVSVLFFFFCWVGDVILGGPFQLRVPCVHLAPRSEGQSWELPALAQSDRWRHGLYPIYIPIYIPLLSLPPFPPVFR